MCFYNIVGELLESSDVRLSWGLAITGEYRLAALMAVWVVGF